MPLKRLKFTLDRKSLEIIYFSFIRPSLEYANVLWAGAHDVETQKLNNLEIEAMRCVTGATARSNLNKLWEDTGWEPLSIRRDNHCILFMFKLVIGEGASYLRDLLPKAVWERTSYSLRSSQNISTPFSRLEILKRSFFPRTLKLWNNLDLALRQCVSFSLFKEKLIKKTDNGRAYFYHAVTRWSGVHHARLRIGCSKLNFDLCKNLHVTTDQTCSCGHFKEDVFHYLMECSRYDVLRNVLFLSVVQYSNFNIRNLLYGSSNVSTIDNCNTFEAVQRFIIDSKRFD